MDTDVGISTMLNQQRRFTDYLISSQENERAAVAKELRENIGQLLASIKLNVSIMTNEYSDYATFVAAAQTVDRLITESMMKMQEISAELRPVALDLLGLSEAMEWFAYKFQQKTGIDCKTSILLKEKKINRELSTSVFRIFQEVLANISRHSGATSVQIGLLDRKGYLVLLVHDDGRGITTEEKNSYLSFGIRAMRQRAEAFGGKLRIFGLQQRGTALMVRMPLTCKETQHARQYNNRG